MKFIKVMDEIEQRYIKKYGKLDEGFEKWANDELTAIEEGIRNNFKRNKRKWGWYENL